MKITRNLMAFAFALIATLSISFISSAWSPATMASQTSQFVNNSAVSDPVVADFSFSSESQNPATANILQKPFQTNWIATQSSQYNTRNTEQFQINYTNFAMDNIGSVAERPPELNSKFEIVQTPSTINKTSTIPQELNSKFEIVPNWRTCKADSHSYFLNDYKPELVWRE